MKTLAKLISKKNFGTDTQLYRDLLNKYNSKYCTGKYSSIIMDDSTPTVKELNGTKYLTWVVARRDSEGAYKQMRCCDTTTMSLDERMLYNQLLMEIILKNL